MGSVPQIIHSEQAPLQIAIPACWFDHCFEGKAVLPAVEAMQHLAASVMTHMPDAQIMAMEGARFDRFFLLDRTRPHMLQALHQFQIYDDGRIASALLSRIQARKGAYTRTKTHVRLCFTHLGPGPAPPSPLMETRDHEIRIPSQTVYSELVPFREAYHNLQGDILLHPYEARAEVYAPADRTGSFPLGSPFPLDAAFHAACVWGQRYAGTVAFPVGCDTRTVFRPTREKESYSILVRPRGDDGADLLFDIWLQGRDGEVQEEIFGVRMRDVSGGRMQPPDWIRKDVPDRNG